MKCFIFQVPWNVKLNERYSNPRGADRRLRVIDIVCVDNEDYVLCRQVIDGLPFIYSF